FAATVGDAVATLAGAGLRIHAFGEMVALLWADGNRDGAIRLEELWNELGERRRFALFCAYPIADFGEEDHSRRSRASAPAIRGSFPARAMPLFRTWTSGCARSPSCSKRPARWKSRSHIGAKRSRRFPSE